ncbi:MAG: hypothetical protein PVI01_18010 [Gemmatimonadales bacterium]|jgi:hypothetical protein
MSAASDRRLQVERWLAELGIRARVESVGEGGAIALVRPEDGNLEGLLSDSRQEIVEACRAVGFRNAAIELFWG